MENVLVAHKCGSHEIDHLTRTRRERMVRQDYSSEMLNGLFRLHFGYRFDRLKVEWIWEAKEKVQLRMMSRNIMLEQLDTNVIYKYR